MTAASVLIGILIVLGVVAWFASALATIGAGAYAGIRFADRHPKLYEPTVTGLGAGLGFIVWVGINVGVIYAATNPGPMW